MDKLEYLEQGKPFKNSISSKQLKLEHFKERLDNLHSTPFDREFTTGTRNIESIQAQLVPEIMLLEEDIRADNKLLEKFYQQVREAASRLSDPLEQWLIELAFIENLNWSQIGRAVHRDRRSVKDWTMKAVEELKLPSNPVILRRESFPPMYTNVQ